MKRNQLKTSIDLENELNLKRINAVNEDLENKRSTLKTGFKSRLWKLDLQNRI